MGKPVRLYKDVGRKIREKIMTGCYQVGGRLPPERDIAIQLGVSRAVVREALIMLELQELVEVRKGSGVYVISRDECDIAPPKLGLEDVGPFEMLQARQLIESNVAQFAATQVTKNDIVELRRALQLEKDYLHSKSSDDSGDEAFHFALAKSTQNSALFEIVETMWKRRNNSPMWNQLHSRIENQEYRKQWLKDHEAILSALTRKNPQAAYQAMWQHLENVKQTLLELSDVEDLHFDGFLFSSPLPPSQQKKLLV